MKNHIQFALRSLLAGSFAVTASVALAQGESAKPPVKVDAAWARASVAGQSATGAFMRLTATAPMRLVGASSPVAGVVEVHEMKMEGEVMRMRPVAGLDLPASKPVELKPGGYHVMMMDLKMPLAAGSMVPLTLLFKDARGADVRQQVQVPVALVAPAASAARADAKDAAAPHSHAGHKH